MTASCAVSFTDAEEVPPAGGVIREGQVPAGGPANAEPASEPQVSRAAGRAGGWGGFAPLQRGPELEKGLLVTSRASSSVMGSVSPSLATFFFLLIEVKFA